MSMVVIDNRTDEALPLEEYRDFSLFILEQQGVQENTELAISYVDTVEMRSLNHQYRGLDEATDVLSFPCDELDDIGEECLHEDLFLLGDLIIAPSVAREHAEEFDSTFEEEMLLMHVHGILHLLGFDHETDAAYHKMRKSESELLAAWALKGVS